MDIVIASPLEILPKELDIVRTIHGTHDIKIVRKRFPRQDVLVEYILRNSDSFIYVMAPDAWHSKLKKVPNLTFGLFEYNAKRYLTSVKHIFCPPTKKGESCEKIWWMASEMELQSFCCDPYSKARIENLRFN